MERSLDAVADGGEALEIGCGVKGGGVRRRVKDGTILKSTFFGALVPRMGTFVMRKIHERSAGPHPASLPSGEEVAHALIDVSVNTTECRSTRPVAEVV